MRPAFTLLCDPFSPIANGGGIRRQAMQAHLVLNAIFFGEICLSDTQCLTSSNLADLLVSDSVTKALRDNGVIKIARRDRGFGGDPLNSLENLVGTFGSNRFLPNSADLFAKCARTLDRYGHMIPWSMDKVSGYYTKRTLDLLNNESKNRALHDSPLHRALLNFTSLKMEENGNLKRDHIRLDAIEHLRTLGFEIPPGYARFLEDVSSAYYFSAVPSTIGAATVYDTSHADILKLAYDIELDTKIDSPILDVPSALDLRFYLEAMSLLDVQDVLKLVECRTAVQYRKDLQVQLVRPSEKAMFNLQTSLFELHHEIDDTMLKKDRRYRAEPSDNNVRRARTTIDISSSSANFLLSLSMAIAKFNLPGLGAVIGVAAKLLRDNRYGDDRLVSHTNAQQKAAAQEYQRRLSAAGKDAFLQLQIPPHDQHVEVSLHSSAFVAP
jgi:hypothetical protein